MYDFCLLTKDKVLGNSMYLSLILLTVLSVPLKEYKEKMETKKEVNRNQVINYCTAEKSALMN